METGQELALAGRNYGVAGSDYCCSAVDSPGCCYSAVELHCCYSAVESRCSLMVDSAAADSARCGFRLFFLQKFDVFPLS